MKFSTKVRSNLLALLLIVSLPVVSCHAEQPGAGDITYQELSVDTSQDTGVISTEKNFLERHALTLVILLVLLVAIALSFRWTNTPYGRLHYLAAVSLKLFTVEFRYKPDRDMDFRLPLPLNFIFVIAGLMPKERVTRIQDITIPSEDFDIPARVYWPKSAKESKAPLPVIVYYHGGGFCLGSVRLFDAEARSIANASAAILVSVDYRLAPRHPYPAAVNDCSAAFKWVSANASSLGGDPAKLMVSGDSAGGNLAAVTALRARDENGPGIAGQILYYPLTDWSSEDYDSIRHFGDGYGLTMEEMHGFREAYIGHLDDYSDSYVSPLCASSLAGLPPALIINAGFDLLTGAADAYARRLEAEGVAVTLVNYSNMIHGFMSIPLFAERRDALKNTREFMKKVVGLPAA